MSLNVIYGTDSNALNMRCKEIISHCADKNVFLIVPEQFSLSAEKYFSDVTKIGFEVISFKRLAGRIFEEAGKITGSYLSSSSKVMLMQSVLDTEKLGIYKTCAEKYGFASTLAKTVSEFKHAAIDPDFVRSKIETSSGMLKEKLTDFAVIFDSYNQKTARFGNDSDDDLTFTYKLLLENPNLYSVAGSVVIISKFSGFTNQERLLIRLFAKYCEVHIAAAANSLQSDVLICFEPTVNNIKRIAEGMDYKTERAADALKQTAAAHLSINYFKYPPEKSDSDGIKIIKMANAYSEINAVAQEIIRLCREEGKRFRDIAVCYRNAEEYKNLIGRIFSNNGIPIFSDGKESINTNALIVFIYAISDIFEYNYSYDAVSMLIKSAFSPVSEEDSDAFENFILAYGLYGNRISDDEVWKSRTERIFKNGSYDSEAICRTRNAIIHPLKKFRENTKGRHSFETHARCFFELLCDFGVYEKLGEIIDELNNEGMFQKAREYSQVWNIFINTLDEAVKFMPEVKQSFSKFMSVLKSGLNENSIGSVPPVADCVTVSDASRFVPGNIKVLFSVGVCSGEFPPAPSGGGMFDEADRDILDALGIELSNSKKHRALAEMQILYKIFSAPEEKIYFSYRTTNSDGTSSAPSEIIPKIHEIFPNTETITSLPQVGSPYYTFERFAENGMPHGSIYDWFASDKGWKSKLMLIAGKTFENSKITLSEESVQKLYENGFSGSVSKLESYSKCAFSYFLNYNLRLKPRKVYTMSAPDIGTLVHSILERCVREVSDSNAWSSVTRESCTAMTENAVKHEAPEFLDGLFLSSPRYRYILSKLTGQLSANLYNILNRFNHSKFRPEGFEINFDSDKVSDMNLKTESGENIRITGKIDRADMLTKDGCKYLRIVDYKTGSKELKLKDIYNAVNLQLITYLDALCGKNNTPAGVLYCVLSSGLETERNILEQKEIEAKLKGRYAMRGLVLQNSDIIMDMDDDPGYIGIEGKKKGGTASAEQFRLLRLSVRKNIKELSSAILRGDISINPITAGANDSPCKYCCYASVCRGKGECRNTKYFNNDEEVYADLAKEFENE